MAVLPSALVDELHRQLMSKLSSTWSSTPVTKSQFRQLLVLIDAELETAETSIVSSLPAGAGKDWLVANPTIGRFFMERVERKRKEGI